ncbi:hypothetical protein LTS08_007563 [Lithohypha guttulata]|nr:hypothetical protein LTR51_002695 [Lithohypha guttulata]KAK5096690.1 hypothetical protein LTS08_007563 [Lithohypha guttulata]
MGSAGQDMAKMRVKEVRIYPIKSIRGVSLQSSQATAMGFFYDRIFMLQRVKDDKNMHVPHFPSMCLFTTQLSPSDAHPDKVLVRFALDHTFDQPEKRLPKEEEVLEVPLAPDVDGLKTVEYTLHQTVTKGYVMPEKMCKWFSDRFGFEVRLNYIGGNKREVLGTVNPNAPQVYVGDPDPKKAAAQKSSSSDGGWLGGIKAGVENLVGTVASYAGVEGYKGVNDGITYADLAPFLVVNWKSFLEAQERVGTTIDMEKFRPNIVVEGAEDKWEEDYWNEISIGSEESGSRIVFTANCPRCASINVDYATGRPAEDAQGQLLKSLQSDRRVDPGMKYSPCFGKYGFLSQKNGMRPTHPITITVGDVVEITKKNDRMTHLYWPGVST